MPLQLPPLVTAADMTALGYPEVPEGVLTRASARVRRYTKQQITPGSSTTELNGIGPWLLPQRPVTGVSGVVDAAGVEVTYQLRGQHLHSRACAPLTVTYSHGFDQLPDVLVELVCQIAVRLNAQPDAVTASARQEATGPFSITWSTEGTAGLTPKEQGELDKIFPRRPRTAVLL